MTAPHLVFSAFCLAAMFGALLFPLAGTLAWWRAWVFLGALFVNASAGFLLVIRARKAALGGRFKPAIREGQPLADKIIVLILVAGCASCVLAIPLDVFRYQWLPPPSTFVSGLGFILFVAGWWIAVLSIRENACAVMVAAGTEESQPRVIETGPYRVVRHPMYAGFVPFFVGMPLWLGSYAAAIVGIFSMATLAVRIVFEERFLARNLPTYEAYKKKVHYRMVPYLW